MTETYSDQSDKEWVVLSVDAARKPSRSISDGGIQEGIDLRPLDNVNISKTSVRERLGLWLRNVFTNRRVWQIIIFGQIISVLNCGTGVTSQLLQERGVNAPTAQLFLNYILLGSVFGSQIAFSNEWPSLRETLHRRGLKYFLLSVVDVEANYCMVKAYQYTTLTSIQVLDGFTVPCVLILSYFLLKARFRLPHYLGVLICLVGMATLILADHFYKKKDSGPSKSGNDQVLGDLLVLLGASLYALSNVGEEYFVKSQSIAEFLGMIGIFGSFVSGIQLLSFEQSQITSIDWSRHSLSISLLGVGFAICMFLLYFIMPHVIRVSSAATINLSLLTADIYSLLFGLFLFHYKFSVVYIVAFLTILFGLAVYIATPLVHPGLTSEKTDSVCVEWHRDKSRRANGSTAAHHVSSDAVARRTDCEANSESDCRENVCLLADPP